MANTNNIVIYRTFYLQKYNYVKSTNRNIQKKCLNVPQRASIYPKIMLYLN